MSENEVPPANSKWEPGGYEGWLIQQAAPPQTRPGSKPEPPRSNPEPPKAGEEGARRRLGRTASPASVNDPGDPPTRAFSLPPVPVIVAVVLVICTIPFWRGWLSDLGIDGVPRIHRPHLGGGSAAGGTGGNLAPGNTGNAPVEPPDSGSADVAQAGPSTSAPLGSNGSPTPPTAAPAPVQQAAVQPPPTPQNPPAVAIKPVPPGQQGARYGGKKPASPAPQAATSVPAPPSRATMRRQQQRLGEQVVRLVKAGDWKSSRSARRRLEATLDQLESVSRALGSSSELRLAREVRSVVRRVP